MAQNSKQLAVRIPTDQRKKLQRVCEAYGVTEPAALRIVLDKVDGLDLSDAPRIREGIKSGQSVVMHAFTAVTKWISARGEAVAWDPEKLRAEAERLIKMLEEWT